MSAGQRQSHTALMGAALFGFLFTWTGAGRADSIVVFNEIQYHPATSEVQLEWIELHNQMAVDVDISSWYLSDGVFYQFPAGTIVEGGDYIVVALDPAALEAETGYPGAFGPFVGRLSNAGERLELRDHNGRWMDRVSYGVGGEWPVSADGSGVSLAKIDPDTRSSRTASWTSSAEIGGTPGRVNFADGDEPPPTNAQGLVSYWSFDESSGQAVDAVGGNHGNLGSGVRRVDGLVGDGAIDLDNSSNALVNVGNGEGDSFSMSGGITIEALIRPEWSGAVDDHDQIFRKEDGSRRIFFSFQHDGNTGTRDVAISPAVQPTLSFGLNIGGTYSELDMPLDGVAGRPTLAGLKDGSTHHVAATYRASTGEKTIWVDGAEAFTTVLTPGDTITSGGIATAYIGNMSGRREPFTGVLDEVAIWERALNAAEIADHRSLTQGGGDYFSGGGGQVDTSDIGVVINETEIPTAGEGRIELYNTGPRVSLEGWVLEAHGTTVGEHVFGAVTLETGAFHVLTATELGFALVVDSRLFLYTRGKGAVVDALRLKDGRRGRSPDGGNELAVPDGPTFGSANTFSFHDEIVINEIFYNPRNEPAPSAGTVIGDVIVPIASEWRFDASGDGQGSGWRQSTFDDAGWEVGDALLYHESGGLPAPRGTELPLGAITYYFRGEFDFDGDPAATEIFFRSVIDDGAVFYLNGVEVLRQGMPDGPVTPATLAAAAIGDATFAGPFAVSAASLRSGRNVIAVEVHQRTAGSSDVVFGLEVSAREIVDVAGGDPTESPEAWVELHNRGTSTVDLSGWRMTRGIRYEFEDGQTIPAGGYLVVAGDRVFLEGLHPDIPIVGDFEGNLSGRSDRLVLEDRNGNVADVVRYHDRQPWPGAADGGGASIELRDPDADNSRPEVWAASDESDKTQWTTYVYTQPARANIGPTRWRDFCLGLLDGGEVLVDDISVIENPGGAERQLIQNGSFASGSSGWRFLGTHRHSEVITDPDDPGNRVLRLVATGATEHMHNHVERTLANNIGVTNGRTYEISFRARWVVGSNQVHTRLYFNRCPRTTLVTVSERAGTPGAENSRRQANIGPTYDGMMHAPVVPASGEPVVVSVGVDDPDGVDSVQLRYSVEGGAWRSASMSLAAGRYRGTIPGQSSSRTVQFYVEAEDGLGASSTYPDGGRDSRALYRTNDGQARLGSVHNVRIIMTPADISRLYASIELMSNDPVGTTVVYNEEEVFYDAGVRLRGSERGRPDTNRVSFNIRFPADHLFRGVHRSIAMDRSGGWSGLVPIQSQDEILVKHTANYAGGIPAMYDDLVRVIAPRRQHTSYALLLMARYNDVFLESAFENGRDGTLFKLELIYHPTTADGNGYKIPLPDGVIGADIRDWGDDKEVYRWNFLIRNNRSRDDYRQFIGMSKAFSAPRSQLDAATEATMDVDEWMRVFAVYSLTGINDSYTFGNNHNNMHYVRPSDGKVLVMMWDADFSFTRGTGASLYGDQNLRRIIELPGNLRRFYGHLDDIIDRVYNTDYMRHWTEHYGTKTGRNFGGILNYIGQRGRFVRGRLPAPVAFRITTNGGADLALDTPTVDLEGDAGIDVQSILVDGLEERSQITWSSLSRWRITVPLVSGENDVRLLGVATSGEVTATDSITVTTTFGLPPPVLTTVEPVEARPGDSVTIRGSELHAGIEVFFGGVLSPLVTHDPGADPGVLVAEVPLVDAGPATITARNFGSGDSNRLEFTALGLPPRFIRGDFNLDGVVDISDPVAILRHLFSGLESNCRDAGDADNDETVDLTDAVRILAHLFQQGPPPAAPYPDPGEDPDGDGPLECVDGL